MNPAPRINNIDFSDDGEIMTVSMSTGFAVFSINPLRVLLNRRFQDKEIGLTSTIQNSSIIICTGVSGQSSFSDMDLMVYDEALGRSVFELSFPDPIKKIKMLPSMFSVTTKTEMRLYTFDPPMLYSQYRNPMGNFLSSDFCIYRNSFMVATTGRDLSTVRIITGEGNDLMFKAHNHGVSKFRLNNGANYVATASENGTVIRIWMTETGEQFAEFRRGRIPVEINSMAFDPKTNLLAISSNNPTIHVFIIPPSKTIDGTQTDLNWKLPSPGTAYLAFDKAGKLLVAHSNGTIYVLRCDTVSKTITSESTTLFTSLLNTTEPTKK